MLAFLSAYDENEKQADKKKISFIHIDSISDEDVEIEVAAFAKSFANKLDLEKVYLFYGKDKKLFMITRANFKWSAPKEISCPVKEEYELVTIIEPISFNEDKTIKEYKEISKYVLKKSLWKDFIESFNLGSVSEQVLNHITKGTPLVTAHSLPAGDYTPQSFLKGAEIVRYMNKNGITLEMVQEALSSSSAKDSEGGAE